jgi:hypothetical protein
VHSARGRLDHSGRSKAHGLWLTADNTQLWLNARFVNLKSIKEPCIMHISSPFFVVSVILAVFVVSILFSTSSKEDKPSAH